MRPFQPGIAAKLNKPVRLLIGVLTVWPIVYFVIFMFVGVLGCFYLVYRVYNSVTIRNSTENFHSHYLGVFIVVHIFTIFLIYRLMASTLLRISSIIRHCCALCIIPR